MKHFVIQRKFQSSEEYLIFDLISDDGLFAVPVSEEKVASHLGDSLPL